MQAVVLGSPMPSQLGQAPEQFLRVAYAEARTVSDLITAIGRALARVTSMMLSVGLPASATAFVEML